MARPVRVDHTHQRVLFRGRQTVALVLVCSCSALEITRRAEMKVLSIKQPWVHAILREGKDIENRSWQGRHTLDYGAICGVARVVDTVTRAAPSGLPHRAVATSITAGCSPTLSLCESQLTAKVCSDCGRPHQTPFGRSSDNCRNWISVKTDFGIASVPPTRGFLPESNRSAIPYTPYRVLGPATSDIGPGFGHPSHC